MSFDPKEQGEIRQQQSRVRSELVLYHTALGNYQILIPYLKRKNNSSYLEGLHLELTGPRKRQMSTMPDDTLHCYDLTSQLMFRF